MAGKKLLVADDSLTIQKVIRLALSNEGYEIQAISDGADVIQHISTFRPDAVLIDVSLPTRTAFEIKRETNEMEDLADTKFILMSSAFEKIDEAQAIEVGFDGRLTKPFDPAHLRQVILEVLTVPRSPSRFPDVTKLQNVPPKLPEAPPKLPTRFPGGIQLEPPGALPPSDFEITLEPTLTQKLPTQEDDELWGRHESHESDEIKHLTESTIRLSGLASFAESSEKEFPKNIDEDFDWKVNEPSMKPPHSLSDIGGSAFQMNPPATANPIFDSPPPIPSAGPPPLPAFEFKPDPSKMDVALDFKITDSKMEEMIRRQIEETLEKMARQLLPELAERVIKAEINKLLNEKF